MSTVLRQGRDLLLQGRVGNRSSLLQWSGMSTVLRQSHLVLAIVGNFLRKSRVRACSYKEESGIGVPSYSGVVCLPSDC